MRIRFPEANYFIAGSRLRPGMDGGYTVATLRRAQQFAEHADVNPVLLTFDFWPDYEQVKDEFVEHGLMSEHTVVRNLLQDARADPGFLRSRATADAAPVVPDDGLTGATDTDSVGRPWRTVWTDATTGVISHTDFLDLEGRRMLRVPYLTGRADWHRASISITVFAADGAPCGTLDGFGGLYRAWLHSVFESSPAGRVNVVVCESRQVGELVVELPDESMRLVHTVHSAHISAPYEWDSPIDGLWASWFGVIDRFDAVVWPTESQRRAVERRFGPRENFWVVSHAVNVEPAVDPSQRDPNLAVMMGRLVPLKRLDHALAAFQRVVSGNPLARMAIFGDGPDEPRLRALAAELGVDDVVEFREHQPDAAESLDEAAVLVLTSTYEGQGLVILEALAHGCPVVSYDINFGPSDVIVDGVSGILVPNGDIDALSDALERLLGDPPRLAELSAGAYASASQNTPERSMQRMAELFERIVPQSRRRPEYR